MCTVRVHISSPITSANGISLAISKGPHFNWIPILITIYEQPLAAFVSCPKTVPVPPSIPLIVIVIICIGVDRLSNDDVRRVGAAFIKPYLHSGVTRVGCRYTDVAERRPFAAARALVCDRSRPFSGTRSGKIFYR